jgi:error-prone DNA polymerase
MLITTFSSGFFGQPSNADIEKQGSYVKADLKVNWRYSDSATIKKVRTRLDDELSTVATLGFESYFLTVADICDMARGAGIRVAARGSGAGSLICHLLGISGVDPLQHGLLMERFC